MFPILATYIIFRMVGDPIPAAQIYGNGELLLINAGVGANGLGVYLFEPIKRTIGTILVAVLLFISTTIVALGYPVLALHSAGKFAAGTNIDPGICRTLFNLHIYSNRIWGRCRPVSANYSKTTIKSLRVRGLIQ